MWGLGVQFRLAGLAWQHLPYLLNYLTGLDLGILFNKQQQQVTLVKFSSDAMLWALGGIFCSQGRKQEKLLFKGLCAATFCYVTENTTLQFGCTHAHACVYSYI